MKNVIKTLSLHGLIKCILALVLVVIVLVGLSRLTDRPTVMPGGDDIVIMSDVVLEV